MGKKTTVSGGASYDSGDLHKLIGPAVPLECQSPFDVPWDQQQTYQFCAGINDQAETNPLCKRQQLTGKSCPNDQGVYLPCCAHAGGHPGCNAYPKDDLLCPNLHGTFSDCCDSKVNSTTQQDPEAEVGLKWTSLPDYDAPTKTPTTLITRLQASSYPTYDRTTNRVQPNIPGVQPMGSTLYAPININVETSPAMQMFPPTNPTMIQRTAPTPTQIQHPEGSTQQPVGTTVIHVTQSGSGHTDAVLYGLLGIVAVVIVGGLGYLCSSRRKEVAV